MSGQPAPGNVDESVRPAEVNVWRLLKASPQKVWEVIGSEAGMKLWLGLHNFQARVGGRILLDTSGATAEERLIIYGRVLEIRAGSGLGFSWRQFREDGSLWPDYTELWLELEEQPGGTLVRLRHTGFERLADWTETAWNVYHHCWVQAPYLEFLGRQAGAEA